MSKPSESGSPSPTGDRNFDGRTDDGPRHTRIAVCLLGTDGTCVDASDEFLRLIGRPRHHVVGRRLAQVFMDIDPAATERLREVVANRGHASERLRVFIAGKGLRCLELAASMATGHLEDIIQVFWSDVTEDLNRHSTPRGEPTVDLEPLLELLMSPTRDEDHSQRICVELSRCLGARAAVLLRPAPGDADLHVVARHGFVGPPSFTQSSTGDTLVALLKSCSSVIGIDRLDELLPTCATVRENAFRSLVAAPIMNSLLQIDGYLVAFDAQGVPHATTLMVTRLAADAVSRSEREARLHDLLAGSRLEAEFRRQAAVTAHLINNELTCILGLVFPNRTAAANEDLQSRLPALEQSAQAAARATADLQAAALDVSMTATTVEARHLFEAAKTLAAAEREDGIITVEFAGSIPDLHVKRRLVVQALADLMRSTLMTLPHDETLQVQIRAVVDPATRRDGVSVCIGPKGGTPSGATNRREPASFALARQMLESSGGSMSFEPGSRSWTSFQVFLPSAEKAVEGSAGA
ncbi:MAG: PAS domain-containing protein [Planctomycetes bacterium]|nr:PAS domain-containing protein [Planctomycetota bacterium]